jgi:subtilisin family serine protease
MKRILTVLALVLAVVVSRGSIVETQSPAAEFVAGELLIQFQPGATAADRADARSWVGALRRELLRGNGTGELEVARVPPGRAVQQAVALLRQHPAVRNAEPNWIYRHHTTSDDSYYTTGLLWGMYGDITQPANQFGSQAGEAWAAGNIGSASVAVGVIDEGIDFNHPDLVANIWTNPVEATGQPDVDDDGNGYIDDLHGWDFSQNNNSIYDGAPGNDTDAHGTHVSGTIGGFGGNTQGVAGVNWNVTLISAKFLGPNGGTLANAVKAIDYITDLKTRHGLNIVATNNSWGGGGFSQALLDAIVRGANAGILFVAAAGNGNNAGVGINNDSTPHYPSSYNTTAGAGYDAVISVASITSTGAKSSFSNYGKTSVDLGAPGSGVWSTTPNNTYSSYSGTSMATPHVTGAVAMYASLNSGASAAAIKAAVLLSASATPTSSLTNITVSGGRLNIGEFAGAPPPSAPEHGPSDLTATPVSSSQIDLAWTDNSTEEDQVDGFEIHRCQGAGCLNFVVVATVAANAGSYSNTGLSANTLYRYEVRAYNSGGTSGSSSVAEATTQPPLAPPAAPTSLTATAGPAVGGISLAWLENSTSEDGFKIERCPGASCTNFTQIAKVGANATTFQDPGGISNRWYRYRVRAFNADGDSAYSNIARTKAP